MKRTFWGLVIGVLLWGCKTGNSNEKPYECKSQQKEPAVGDWVIIHALDDPDNLNLLNHQGATAGYILDHIFQSPLVMDFETYELVPQLAVARPTIEEKNGKVYYHFEIRPEAVWDDGKPVTGYDYAFTIKAIKNPLVDCHRIRPYYEAIEDVIVDNENPKKFTVVFKEKYFLAEEVCGTQAILPKHIYDPEGIMDKFTIPQLNRDIDKLRNNPDIRRFAEHFNAPRFQSEIVVGSGPYRFVKWEKGIQIELERKKDWWGDKVKDPPPSLRAYPEKIIYRVVNDQNAAITDLKAQRIDVMSGLRPKDFIEVKKNKKIQNYFRLFTPPSFSYSYLGLNNHPPEHRPPLFTDKRVRLAFAHLVNVDTIIKTVLYGLGQRIIGPVSPLLKDAYNDQIQPIPYDLEKAKKLLEEAGWKDSDGDGILDKIIDGKKVDFRCEFAINQGNETRKQIALIVQQEAKKVGIEIEIASYEWSVYLDKAKKHDFDIMYVAWIGTPSPPDLKQIWHTESWAGGSNYIGFGFNTPESDQIIEAIRRELDEKKRNELYKRFQEILYEEMPCVFLFSVPERIVIHKRFRNVKPSAMRPGYDVHNFWTPKECIKYGKQQGA